MTLFNIIKRVYKYIKLCMKTPFILVRGSRFSFTSIIEKDVYLRKSTIGKYCSIGMHGYYNRTTVGNYTSIAGGVTIGAMEHSHWALSTSTYLSNEGYDNRETIIGNDVWIGTQCVIRQGVKIGNGAVVGANSFVNKDIPPFAIVFGTPAKVYKYRFDEKTIKIIQESEYWLKSPSEAKQILITILDGNNK